MALANSRPLQIPTLENEILHNSNSPVFQLSSMGFTTRADTISNPGMDLVGNQSSMSLDDNSLSGSSFSSSQETKTLKSKKDSGAPKKDNPLLEISKLIPVTGERPKPENRDSPLDDDVLHAVFVILWEMDPNQQGMTVKQLCDLLLQKHPDMSNLSTKLSNLISAKLNAYVKKIEKGEKTLIYALSREWSNSSPRRMLYIYRGILSPDYKEHAQAVTMKLKSQLERSGGSNDFNSKKKKDSNSNHLGNNDNYSDSVADMKNLSSNSSFSKNLNVGNLAFSLSPEFNIPYSTSPVSLNLSPSIGSSSQQQLQSPSVSTPVLKNKNSNKKRSYPDDDANDLMTESKKNKAAKPGKQTKSQSPSVLSTPKKVPSSTSLSTFANSKIISPDSSVSHNTPSSTYVTAAAAAPRLSKLLPKNGFKKNSRSSSELAAIHKVISTQTPIESSSESSVYSSSSSSPISNTATGSTESLSDHSSSQDNETESNLSSQEPRNEVTNWMKIVRNGFLTHDIESPESITLDDLENIFN